jgi:hypothetical protein
VLKDQRDVDMSKGDGDQPERTLESQNNLHNKINEVLDFNLKYEINTKK